MAKLPDKDEEKEETERIDGVSWALK